MTDAIESWTNRSPGDLTFEFPEVHSGNVADAVRLASKARHEWGRTPFQKRSDCLKAAQSALQENAESLSVEIARETGKPLTEARGELQAVVAKIDLTLADGLRHLADETVGDGPHPGLVRRLPIGPAAVIAPFNFPLHLGHGATVAHLLAGNPVLFKPSPLAANVAESYGKIMAPCFPDGVFQIVQGGAATGMALCEAAEVRAICFTGSVSAGRTIARAVAADFSKELALELGGKNPAIICDDADLELAARAVADAMCLTCGQRCNATSWILVDQAVKAEFLDRLKVALEVYQPGDPLDSATKLGPLASEMGVRRYEETVKSGQGRWRVKGGVIPSVGGKQGRWVLPAVLEVEDVETALGSPVHLEECFAPVLEVYAFNQLEEAERMIARSSWGLTVSIFTRSGERFRALASGIRAGNVYANLPTTFSPGTLPFGGLGDSGNGRPGGRGFIRFATGEQALQWKADGFAGG